MTTTEPNTNSARAENPPAFDIGTDMAESVAQTLATRLAEVPEKDRVEVWIGLFNSLAGYCSVVVGTESASLALATTLASLEEEAAEDGMAEPQH